MALTHLTQLLDDPRGFLKYRLVYLVQRHPLWRAHHQAVRPHTEADGAALAAFEFIGHYRVLHPCIAVGAGVAKIGRQQGLGQSLGRQISGIYY